MHITLIGMSNIGKSYWARRLVAEAGFELVDCDGLIEQKLGPELQAAGPAGTRGMAAWMGQPYEQHYAETSRKYRDAEVAVMQEVGARLKAKTGGKPLIIDTTGSVIYVRDGDLEPLKSFTRIVYLEASKAHAETLFARYKLDPKPNIWLDHFRPLQGEAPGDALHRCYPELLASRARSYARLAHVTIPYEQHRDHRANVATIIGAAS